MNTNVNQDYILKISIFSVRNFDFLIILEFAFI